MTDVTITIDTPVYNITDQSGFIGLVREAVNTVNDDNAFMTLIDYDNIELVLPVRSKSNFKADPMLCCHQCPEGHAYKLGNCGKLPETTHVAQKPLTATINCRGIKMGYKTLFGKYFIVYFTYFIMYLCSQQLHRFCFKLCSLHYLTYFITFAFFSFNLSAGQTVTSVTCLYFLIV